jgi:GH35 family endo-1,4-beta-xylanase
MKLKRLTAALVSLGMVVGIVGATPVSYVSAVETPVFNTFDVNYDGWYNVGDYSNVTALPGGYNSARAMFVDGRQSVNDGAEAQKGFYLDGGIKYNYSVFVKADTDEEFILTLRYLYPDETYGYETLAVKNAKAGEWTELKAVYAAPEGTVNLSPIISTNSTNDFWFDSFKVTNTTEKVRTFTVSAAQDGDKLKDVYANYFRVGGCVSSYGGLNDSTVQGIILKQYNSITPENELKPDSTVNINGSSGNNVAVTLNSASTIIEFCIQNNIAMRGHVLLWHAQTPHRLFRAGFQENGVLVSKADMEERMDSYIKNMFSKIANDYPDLNLYAYDVVNEAFSDSKTMSGNNWRAMNRDPGFDGTPGANAAFNNSGSPWVNFWGDNSFIETAFDIAYKYRNDYLPNMKLFYNDYNEYLGLTNGKHAAMKALATELFEKGTLDGIGMQSHVGDAGYYSRNDFLNAMDSFLSVGCEVQLTELDVISTNTAAWYKDIFTHAVEKSAETGKLTAVVIWGTKTDISWLYNDNKDKEIVLFSGNGSPYASYTAIAGSAIVPESEWGDGDNPKVNEGGKVIEPPKPDEYGRFFFDTFETDEGAWAARDGGGQVTIARSPNGIHHADDGLYALSVSGRENTWMGTSHSLNARAFVPGGTYKFGGMVMSPTVETNFQLSVYYILDSKDTYVTIDTGTAAAGEWCNLEATIEIPTGASSMMVYFETEYFEEEGGNLTDFFLDNAYGGVEDAVSPLVDIEPKPTTTSATTTTTTTTSTTSTTSATQTSATTGIEPTEVVYGDIDDDGQACKITDVILLSKHVSKKLQLPSGSAYLANADVNQKVAGAVDTNDLKTVIDVLLGTESLSSLPIK